MCAGIAMGCLTIPASRGSHLARASSLQLAHLVHYSATHRPMTGLLAWFSPAQVMVRNSTAVIEPIFKVADAAILVGRARFSAALRRVAAAARSALCLMQRSANVRLCLCMSRIRERPRRLAAGSSRVPAAADRASQQRASQQVGRSHANARRAQCLIYAHNAPRVWRVRP